MTFNLKNRCEDDLSKKIYITTKCSVYYNTHLVLNTFILICASIMRKNSFNVKNDQILAFFVKFEVIFDQLHSEDDIPGKKYILKFSMTPGQIIWHWFYKCMF